MEIKQRYTFKKEEKLKSRKAIDQLFKEGNSFSAFPFRVLWMFNETIKTPLQTGVTVSSKHFKKAVDRNRIKRLMREAYRLQKNDLQTELLQQSTGSCGNKQIAIFIIYVGNELPEYDLVFQKMGSVLKRLKKIINEDLSANT